MLIATQMMAALSMARSVTLDDAVCRKDDYPLLTFRVSSPMRRVRKDVLCAMDWRRSSGVL